MDGPSVEAKTSIWWGKSSLNIQQARLYLLAKPAALEDFPFGPDTRVFKVKTKMFALMSCRKDRLMINFKCGPDEALALCDIFPGISSG